MTARTTIRTVMGEVEMLIPPSPEYRRAVQEHARAIRADHRSADKLRRQYARQLAKAAGKDFPPDAWVEFDERERCAAFYVRRWMQLVPLPWNDMRLVENRRGPILGYHRMPDHFFGTAA